MSLDIRLDHHLIHEWSKAQMENVLAHLVNLEDSFMAAIDDLKAAVNHMQTVIAANMAALDSALQTEFRQVRSMLDAKSQDPAIADAVAQLNTMADTLHAGIGAAVEALNAELPPEPKPDPEPAPAPEPEPEPVPPPEPVSTA